MSGDIPSGWLSLKSIKTKLVYSAKTPKKTIKMRAGTMPTAANDEGKESVPYVTWSGKSVSEDSIWMCDIVRSP